MMLRVDAEEVKEVMEVAWVVGTTMNLVGRALVAVIQIGHAHRVALLGLMEGWLADYG